MSVTNHDYENGAIKEAVSGIKRELYESLKRIENKIVSYTPISLFAEEDFQPSRLMDLDFQLVLKEVNDINFNYLQSALDKICDKYSNESIKVVYALRAGPEKPRPGEQCTILLHGAINTDDTYGGIPEISRYTLQRHKPVIGKPLKEIAKAERVTVEKLINGPQGIETCIHIIEDKKINRVYWKKINDSYKMVFENMPSDEFQRLDSCYYAVLRCATNALIAKGYDTECDKDMTYLFAEVFPSFKYKNVPQEIWNEKKQNRDGYDQSIIDLPKTEAETIDFLKALGNEILACHR